MNLLLDQVERSLTMIEELSARYRRHSIEESDYMAGLMAGWLQAISLATGQPIEQVRKELDRA